MKYSLFILLSIFFISSNLFAQNLIAEPPHITQPSNNVYLTVKPDLRKCVSPICGGWIVKPVNRRVLKCPDGSVRRACYVGTDKISITHLSDDQLNELRQAMSASRVLILANVSNRIDYGLLVINAAWLSASSQRPIGRFVSLSDSGVRCITHPCPSFDARILNRYSVKSLAGYDLTRVDADREQLERARMEVQTDEGLHLAGRFVEVSGPAGNAQGIEASQFYLKLVGVAPKMCKPTGCSGQVCSNTEINTTCEWRPEYTCYRAATCSTQKNKECGWVMDDELKRCLANSFFDRMLFIEK